MIAAAWICLFAPLGAAIAITLAGQRLTRRGAGYLATASVGVSFVAAVVSFALLLGDAPHDRSHPSTLWRWLTAGPYDFGLRILVDPLSVFMMLVVAGACESRPLVFSPITTITSTSSADDAETAASACQFGPPAHGASA